MVKISDVIANQVIASNSPLFRRALSLCRSGMFERVGRYLVRKYDGIFKQLKVSLRGSKLTVSFEFLNAGDELTPIGVSTVRDYTATATWSVRVERGRGTERVDVGRDCWDFLVLELPYPVLKLTVRGPESLKISKFMRAYGVFYQASPLGSGRWDERDVIPGLYGYSRV